MQALEATRNAFAQFELRIRAKNSTSAVSTVLLMTERHLKCGCSGPSIWGDIAAGGSIRSLLSTSSIICNNHEDIDQTKSFPSFLLIRVSFSGDSRPLNLVELFLRSHSQDLCMPTIESVKEERDDGLRRCHLKRGIHLRSEHTARWLSCPGRTDNYW